MKSKIIIVVLVVLAAVAIGFKLRSNTKAAEREVSEELKPVNLKLDTSVVSLTRLDNKLIVTGTTEARSLVAVISETDGKVIATSLVNGKRVVKGQVLVRFNTQMKEATHNMHVATYQKAKQDYERVHQLLQEKNASQAEVDNARLQLQHAEQQVSISAKQLEQATITSPISGVVVEKKVNVGEVVMTGNSVATIAEIDPLIVKVFLSESQVLKVKTGQQVNVITGAYPDKRLKGEVSAIIPVATQAKSFPVEVMLDNTDHQPLMAGMIVTLEFEQDRPDAALLVPRTAIVTSGQETYVYVLTGREVHKRVVSLGSEHSTRIAITKGLVAGETIVTRGQQILENESRIANYTIVR